MARHSRNEDATRHVIVRHDFLDLGNTHYSFVMFATQAWSGRSGPHGTDAVAGDLKPYRDHIGTAPSIKGS
jgi:hypothetical protein